MAKSDKLKGKKFKSDKGKDKGLKLTEIKSDSKFKGWTMGALIEALKKVPFGSEAHSQIHKALSKHVAKKYPEQYVLAVKNKFVLHEIEHSLAKYGDVTPFDQIDHNFGKRTFGEDDNFTFVSREEAEYNFEWKQVSVFGFVTDGTNYLLLRKNETNEITMIGGHVDYSLDIYRKPQLEILREAMETELKEEVKHGKQLTVPEKPIALVNTFNKFNDIFHMAFIYKIEVDDLSQFAAKTGEPEKHSVITISSKESLLTNPDIHHWFKTIEEYL